MRLNLQQIMHVPGASIPFAFQLDLSQEAFFGEYPISRPVTVTGLTSREERGGCADAGGRGQVPSGLHL